MHQFKSSSIKVLPDYVHECWSIFLSDPDMIGTYKIRVSVNKSTFVIKLSSLKYFQAKCEIRTEGVDQYNFHANPIR